MHKEAPKTQLADCQSQADLRQLRIDRVGVRGLRYPIEVRDKHHETQDTVASISLLVDLPQDFKGTHMSRFVEVLNAHGRLVHVENLPRMLHELQRKLQAQVAHIEMDFPYFMEKEAPVTRAKGLVDYQVKFDAAAHGKDVMFTVDCDYSRHHALPVLQVDQRVRRAQPARLRHARAAFGGTDLDRGHDHDGRGNRPVAKSTRCSSGPTKKPSPSSAYDNPVFVEDLVRNVALRCNQHPDITWYKVEAENMESIHNHSAYACIEKAR